ncbi:MAG: ribose-phosphate pyrophosphokinase [Candidatus Micrarchaeota archaeon]|nr:ribose-phosphate pyrophosphokinase [Candidatus Micrarchaeota archaeon]
MVFVIGGSGSNGIDAKLAKILGAKHMVPEIHEFPDGEYKIRMPHRLGGEPVIIVQSTYYPQDRRIFELLLISDLARDMGAERIGAVIPYLAFARQNKSFVDGESVSIKTVMSLLNAVGISYLVTVQPHKMEPLGYFKGEVDVVEPIVDIISHVRREVSKPFVMAPDKASMPIAKAAAESLGCGHDYLDKERDLVTGKVRIKKAPDVDLDGMDVIIVDDMISTGGTIITCADFAYSKGAKNVVAAAAHLLMSGDAEKRLKAAKVNMVFGANTIPCKAAKTVDISNAVAERIKEEYELA